MLRKFLIYSLLSALATGCIRENMGDCGKGLRLRFRYTCNKQDEDRLAGRVRDIRVYVFDRNGGALAAVIRPGRDDIARGYADADLPDGSYTVVAWGGGGEDMTQGGYRDAGVTAGPSYEAPTVTGGTMRGDFRMMLADDPYSGGEVGDVIPRVADFDDLFFAVADDVRVAGNIRRVVDMDFIRNTPKLMVTVTGIEHLSPVSGAAPGIFVTSRNGIYEYDNRIDPHAPRVHYLPHNRTLTATSMETAIKIQRLDMSRRTGESVLLHLLNPVSGADMIPALDVVDVIMQVRDDRGNLLYRTQRDIDREEEFPIEISIMSDLSVSVTVNGYGIADPTPDIGRP